MQTFYHRSDYVFPSPTGRRWHLRDLDRLRYTLGEPGELHPWEREVCFDVERGGEAVQRTFEQEHEAGGFVRVWGYPVFEEEWKRVILRTEFWG